MELTPIYKRKRVIGLDVHQAQISSCAIIEQADGTIVVERREFGGFKRDRKALAEWARRIGPDVVVMKSTGIYWKSPYAAFQGVASRQQGKYRCQGHCRTADQAATTATERSVRRPRPASSLKVGIRTPAGRTA